MSYGQNCASNDILASNNIIYLYNLSVINQIEFDHIRVDHNQDRLF